MEEYRCETCDRNFKTNEALAMHNAAKHSKLIQKPKKQLPTKKIISITIFIIIGLIAGGIIFWLLNIKTLPPTDIKGHVEANPGSHILKEPMPITIQKHMLEHVDGIEGGRGGVIINYNCIDYECEENLIENLEAFANKYEHVYVAPFKRMNAKIALTKLNKREILEDYDNETIERFIQY